MPFKKWVPLLKRRSLVDRVQRQCYLDKLKADITGLEEEQGICLELTVYRRKSYLPVTVIWLNKTELHEKPVGFGVRFTRNEKKIVGRIVE